MPDPSFEPVVARTQASARLHAHDDAIANLGEVDGLERELRVGGIQVLPQHGQLVAGVDRAPGPLSSLVPLEVVGEPVLESLDAAAHERHLVADPGQREILARHEGSIACPETLTAARRRIYGRRMNPNKALWEKGDFTEIAEFMRESGEELAGSVGAAAGTRILDLGCGDGTTALPFAQLGADVTGIDIAANLVEAGNRRAAEAGLDNVTFVEGDASDLQAVEADSFDLTFSCFGAMFAPKPFDVAKEMVRVTKKPGGRIVMCNWIPNDDTSFVSQLLKISAAFSPPPPEGFISPVTWGVEANVVERFAAAGVAEDQIETATDRFVFRSPDL